MGFRSARRNPRTKLELDVQLEGGSDLLRALSYYYYYYNYAAVAALAGASFGSMRMSQT